MPSDKGLTDMILGTVTGLMVYINAMPNPALMSLLGSGLVTLFVSAMSYVGRSLGIWGMRTIKEYISKYKNRKK